MFGHTLRAARKRASLRLIDVAGPMKTSQAYLSLMERGTVVPFPRSRWPALMEAIPGLTMAELEGGMDAYLVERGRQELADRRREWGLPEGGLAARAGSRGL